MQLSEAGFNGMFSLSNLIMVGGLIFIVLFKNTIFFKKC